MILLKEKLIKYIQLSILVTLIIVLAGCANTEDDSYQKHSDAYGEREELIHEYQDCMKKYADDMLKTEQCKKYLKESEALK